MDKDKFYLDHIIESIDHIEEYIENIDRKDFLALIEKQDSVIKRLEVIGEAANNLSDNFKNKHSNIFWRDIIDMRNFLIHEYFGVDMNIVWQTVKEDLGKLKEQLQEII